jgi:hypothetical protein
MSVGERYNVMSRRLILELCMLAFGMMRELFSREDLARVYNVLMEKEVRLHGELDGMENGVPRPMIELPHDETSDED